MRLDRPGLVTQGSHSGDLSMPVIPERQRLLLRSWLVARDQSLNPDTAVAISVLLASIAVPTQPCFSFYLVLYKAFNQLFLSRLRLLTLELASRKRTHLQANMPLNNIFAFSSSVL